jgi:hypothetical protein
MTTRKETFFAEFCAASLGALFFASLVGLCILGPATTARAQDINIISFDAPGADTNPGDNNGTYSSGINVWGTITGSYQDTNNTYHGFLRSPEGKFITFEAPGADMGPYNGTNPSAINDLGTITGAYYDANGFGHGFLRSAEGNFTSFDVPGVGGYGTTSLAINLEGAVVGYYTDSNYSFHAFLRSPAGKFTTWIGPSACTGNGSEGCYGSGATNINAFETVVGGYEDNSGNFVHHSFVRSPQGKLNTFDVPAAGTGSYQGTGCPGCGLGFNQLGAVAGTYIDENSVQHGFLRNPSGTITTFDAPGAGTSSYQGTGCSSDCPTSLNDFGAISGIYIDSNWVFHGYLRSSSGNIVTVDPSASVFTWSSGINDFGVIAGYYADVNNVYHGFVAASSNAWSSENDEATTPRGPATTTKRDNPTFHGVLNPKLRLMPWNRSTEAQPSK